MVAGEGEPGVEEGVGEHLEEEEVHREEEVVEEVVEGVEAVVDVVEEEEGVVCKLESIQKPVEFGHFAIKSLNQVGDILFFIFRFRISEPDM